MTTNDLLAAGWTHTHGCWRAPTGLIATTDAEAFAIERYAQHVAAQRTAAMGAMVQALREALKNLRRDHGSECAVYQHNNVAFDNSGRKFCHECDADNVTHGEDGDDIIHAETCDPACDCGADVHNTYLDRALTATADAAGAWTGLVEAAERALNYRSHDERVATANKLRAAVERVKGGRA